MLKIWLLLRLVLARLHILLEAVVQRCSVKKAFLKITSGGVLQDKKTMKFQQKYAIYLFYDVSSKCLSEACLDLSQAFIMEHFAKTVSIFLLLTIFTKGSIIDVFQNSEYTFASHSRNPEVLLTHSFPMHPFSTPWKHQKIVRFSDVFRE